jgi:peptidoglycan biosynthesis protein MviN/MurJ (putative lipid II flippase)
MENIVLNLLSRGLLFLSYAMIARKFGASAYTDLLYLTINISGITSSLILIHFSTNLFAVFCNQGVSADKQAIRKMAGEYLGFTIGSSAIILFFACCSTVPLLSNKGEFVKEIGQSSGWYIFGLALVSIIIYNISDFFRLFLQTQALAARSAQAIVIQNAVFLAGIVTSKSIEFAGKIVAIYVLSQFVGLIGLISVARSKAILPIIRFTPAKYFGFFRVSAIAIVAHTITCTAGYYFEIKSISAGEKVLTYLNNGMRLANIASAAIFVPAIEIISVRIVSLVSADRERAAQYLTECINTFFMLGVIVAVNLLFFSKPLVETLYGGNAYSVADIRVTSSVVTISALSIPFAALTQLQNRLLITIGLVNRSCLLGIIMYTIQLLVLFSVNSSFLNAEKLATVRACTEILLVFPATMYITIKYAPFYWEKIAKNCQLLKNVWHILVAGIMWSCWKIAQLVFIRTSGEYLSIFGKIMFLSFMIASLVISLIIVGRIHTRRELIK